MLVLFGGLRTVAREDGPNTEDRGGKDEELSDEIQDRVMDLTGRWSDKARDAEGDGSDE